MKYIIILLAILFSINSFADNFTTRNAGGVWNDIDTWDDGSTYPSTTADNATIDNGDNVSFPGTGVKITISELILNNNAEFYLPEDDTLVCDSISVINRADVLIDGVLLVVGGIHMRENSFLNLDATGSIEVGGDFYGRNNVDLNIDGNMHVSGDFTLGNNSEITGGGSITVDGDVSIPGDADNGGILPIDLLYFKTDISNNAVALSWATASEINNNYFTIERSFNGIDFEEIATIDGAGTSSQILEYSYNDKLIREGIAYYRLKQTDFDGEFETYNAVAIEIKDLKLDNVNSIHMSDSELITSVTSQNSSEALIVLSNINGQIIKKQNITLNKGTSSHTLNINNIDRGIYLLTLYFKGKQISRKFIY